MTTTRESITPYALGEVQSAKTFALIGFIFYAIAAAGFGIAALIVFFLFIPLAFTPFPFFPFVIPFAVFLPLAIALTVWSWFTLQDIEAGSYARAQTASLVLGILGLFVTIISGIFFILAYVKLGSAITYAQTPPPSYPPAPATGRFCTECGRAIPMDAKFCTHCGRELA